MIIISNYKFLGKYGVARPFYFPCLPSYWCRCFKISGTKDSDIENEEQISGKQIILCILIMKLILHLSERYMKMTFKECLKSSLV